MQKKMVLHLALDRISRDSLCHPTNHKRLKKIEKYMNKNKN
ncbi:hypothetical protein RU98_GL003024 [Enterococcus caccae]|nr:hypothetical protein RU98_GL003024 [Enterococcus caccae]